MIDDVYNKRILELAANIPLVGRLENPDGTAMGHSRLCGSKVTVDVRVEDRRIAEFAHDVKACALGQASSSLMASRAVGSTLDELRDVRDTVYRMLKDNGSPPGGRWEDLKYLEPVRDFKARHASTLLTFDATVEAMEKALARQQA